ncbi:MULTISPECIES: response regulator transcription factor [Thermomonospora]|uniref:Two component transcriptional regulator, LuxR family n=1 Tax=Thermomonospora curvata (strain ATCC 19995 / DSM 43183 / JCM 3096 / KCTC 9072 / NBRC 15933 / NCIMB 10081 / Henssen B9) TaxID=471852 RepID=D1A7X7_THECD|nr:MULTISPECIES: response regulator transcription factor [Thermomonospora]ACY98499.1 two component transcriptional regulator, LuxR family [Thermomonospora curvata DSM 43183]PKK13644.1 MAG: DNA-binding response regulator [Thermomonospora sp. CIF 1]
MIKILLADDEHLIRGAVAALLNLQPDLEVVAEIGRGDQVLAAVREHDPDVAVLDIDMPGADGLTVAEQLRETGARCAVCILTSLGRPGYLRRAMAAGVRGFIAKDAPAEDLAAAVRKVHAGGRYLDAELAASAMAAGDNPLTERERQILRLIGRGMEAPGIAEALHLSQGTVRNYLSSAMTKLDAPNRLAAVRTAEEMGWI